MLLSILARIAVGLLLIIHGFAHYNLTTLWGAKPEHTPWLLGANNGAALRPLGSALWVASLFIFLVAGVLTFTNQPLWRVLTVAGAGLSLLTMLLFWDAKMILGVIVDAAVLVALLCLKLPPTTLIR